MAEIEDELEDEEREIAAELPDEEDIEEVPTLDEEEEDDTEDSAIDDDDDVL